MSDKRSIFYEELRCQYLCEKHQKDILMVVRDQYEYVKKCLESLYKYTQDFMLYLWDNHSSHETADFLYEVSCQHTNVHLTRTEKNQGFIIPNNRLAALGKSPFIILLNSDTEVREGWSEALIGYLLEHPEVGEIGYHGSALDAAGIGFPAWSGAMIDFIPGWCLCLRREIYNDLGLFDESHLEFAYGEDSDLSLRIKEAGYDLYALHLDLVVHFGNKTISQVQHEQDVTATFAKNHEYIKQRHAKYLATKRAVLKKPLQADLSAINPCGD